MNIGILGGTFNPIHNGHIAIANYAMEQCGLDKVVVMTGAVPPHKGGSIPDARIRHKMVCAAVSDYENIFPDDYEIKKGGISYTAETLRDLHSKSSSDNLYFIMGGDSLVNFHKWYKPDEISEYCTIAVYPRSGEDIRSAAAKAEKDYNARIITIKAPIIQISSTGIRQRVKERKPIGFLVPECVGRIIKEEELYV